MTEEVIKVKESILTEQYEEGRNALKAGIKFVIEKIVISEKTRYKKISKMDGYIDLKGKKSPVKYYTTSAVITRQCEAFLSAYGASNDGSLKPNIEVEVISKKSESGYEYLTFI